jgi:hypothetical protein
VYKRAADGGNAWQQTNFMKASNAESNDEFGRVVALSKDGKTLAVGAPFRDIGIGDTVPNGNSGAAYVFTQSPDGMSWGQQTMVTAFTPKTDANFGQFLALSGDGNTLVVSAIYDSSAASATDDSETENGVPFSGAAYVVARDGDSQTWLMQAFLKASDAAEYAFFGDAIAVSDNGSTVAVGAWGSSAGAASAWALTRPVRDC